MLRWKTKTALQDIFLGRNVTKIAKGPKTHHQQKQFNAISIKKWQPRKEKGNCRGNKIDRHRNGSQEETGKIGEGVSLTQKGQSYLKERKRKGDRNKKKHV